jgi:hypothetical protein
MCVRIGECPLEVGIHHLLAAVERSFQAQFTSSQMVITVRHAEKGALHFEQPMIMIRGEISRVNCGNLARCVFEKRGLVYPPRFDSVESMTINCD